METKTLRKKNTTELHEELLEQQRALFSLRVRAATQQLKNTSEFKRVCKDIARIKTIQRERIRAAS